MIGRAGGETIALVAGNREAIRRPDGALAAPGALVRPTPAPDGSTYAAVLALQRSAGNALVGRFLARFLHDVVTPTFVGSKKRPMLRANQTDPAVNELQQLLNAAGAAPPLDLTGTMDVPTRRAVVKFQGETGLERDCIVGPLTWGALDRVTGTAREPTDPDQHADVHRPSKDEGDEIQKLLFPGRGKDDTPWDGAGKSATATANRADLKTRMHAAMSAALARLAPDVEKWSKADRMPIKGLEPTGHEAKRLADDKFKPLVAAAARTKSQEAGLAAFDYTAGVNLFDAADKSARPPDAFQASGFLALSEPASKQAVADHHLDRDRTPAEKDFFYGEIVQEFADAKGNKEPLEKYHQFGFSQAKDGKVLAQTTLDDPKFPNKQVTPGEPTPAVRHLQWKMLHTLVHEYIHLLEHPALRQARGNNDVLRVGFCEMFTKEVMVPVTAAAKGGDATIRIGVEGGDFPKGFSPDLIPDYAPADQYAEFLKNAEGVRDALGAGGPAAVHAAFFQGHVELLGLTPEGKRAAPAAAGSDDLVTVPHVIHTPFALAVMTGSSPDAIMAANPGLKPNGPLPAKVHVPGCRYHRVAEAVEREPGGGKVVDRQGERAEQIAEQNGITVADLERANPGLNKRVPKAGEELLIPVRS